MTTEEKPGVMGLVGEMAGAVLDLADNTVQLAACEARVVVQRLAKRLGIFFVSLVVAALGLILVLGGAALLLQRVTGMPDWLALFTVGGVTLGLGAFVALRSLKRLGDPDLLFPATLAEFRADVETLGGKRRAAAAKLHDERFDNVTA